MTGKGTGDARFAMLNAPMFNTIKKDKHKVELDDRFKAALQDDRFALQNKGGTDKYGRKSKGGSGKEDLSEFYKTAEDANKIKKDASKDTKQKKVVHEAAAEEQKESTKMTRLEYLTKLSRLVYG